MIRFLQHKIPNLTVLVFICSIIAPTIAAADAVKPFFIVGLASGGDTLIDTNNEDLDTGGLLYFGGGAIYEPINSNLMYQFSLGYKFDSINFTVRSGGITLADFGFIPGGTYGDASMSVLPLDAVAFFKVDALRLGLGLSYFMNPKYELCFDFSGCSTTHFDDAIGLVLELRHQWTDILFWSARYTNVDYKVGSSTLDASNLRLNFGMVF